MMTMTDLTDTCKKLKTMLVVIDPSKMTYKRYVGREPGVKVKAEAPLLDFEIEMFRTHPERMLPTPPPELA